MSVTPSLTLPPPLGYLLGLGKLNRVYSVAKSSPSEAHFFDRAIDALGVEVDVDEAELSHIPTDGPTIVVANHPFGALDGLIASSLSARRHPNVQVLANQWLGRIPELRPWLLAVDVFGDRPDTLANASVLKSAVKHLRRNGLLVVFPAGVVSHWQPGRQGIVNPQWNRLVAVMARKTRAAVVPMFFEGRNSLGIPMRGAGAPGTPNSTLAQRTFEAAWFSSQSQNRSRGFQ